MNENDLRGFTITITLKRECGKKQLEPYNLCALNNNLCMDMSPDFLKSDTRKKSMQLFGVLDVTMY